MENTIEYPDEVFCPLIDSIIDSGECVENSDVASSLIKEQSLPEIYKQKENWREICIKCKYHDY